MSQAKTTIEEQLQKNGTWLFQTVGDSMEPLLHNRESTVQLTAGNEGLRKYDVVLYKRPNGIYVLHRIRRIRGNRLRICGDNRVGLEKVPREWVLGRMTGFYPGEGPEYTDCKDPAYRQYVKTLPFRYVTLWIKKLPERILRKLRRAR